MSKLFEQLQAGSTVFRPMNNGIMKEIMSAYV
jgi:hypothetical protein